ncbi:MAG TPA: prolyl oligopeptidase family serine peptidase, partial [Rhizomicrobium sp.]|nr:prolyl oligopeptidase family serine peptidase [Rhizomicrobium sp.]
GRTVSIFKNPTFDVYALFLNCWTRRVLGVDYVDDLYKIKWFDPSMQALQRGLEAAFPGSNVILVSHDVAFEKVIVRVSSVSEPWTYYLLDRKTHLAGRIGVSYPLIHSHDLGAVKPYPYKARDGLDIPGYLTLPPGKEPKNLPLVVIPHGASSGGGPDSRDSMDFNWLTQFLANRGYAVLQPNYRGSFGYGYPFRKAGFKQWGLKTQDDVTDGVNKVIADGIADPKRVCIYGADYGGYIALEGAELTPQLYRCVISYAGISDWLDYLRIWEEEARPHSKTMSYLNSRIGVASEDHEKLKATSPALHAEKIMSPVLLMHGESDYTVRIHQSQEMYDALRQAGKQVQFIKFTGEEDHYLQQAESRIRLLTEIEKFLKENIGN